MLTHSRIAELTPQLSGRLARVYGYTSLVGPALFGAQIALSFTPSEGKQLPFMNAGPHLPGRQADFCLVLPCRY